MGDEEAAEGLREAVKMGRPFNKDGDPKARVTIDAELIRQLLLGLADGQGDCSPIAPAGVELHYATITGRLSLDRVIGANGGAIPALELHRCYLTEGFSGAHGKFSRLCFFECTFGDPNPDKVDGRPIPTVDLVDAHIDSDLNMEGVRPEGLGLDDDWPRQQGPYLWIRAVGAQINGKVELSRCRLRAPPPRARTPICDEDEDALNLALATIRGDLWFLCDARCEGRFKLRAAHVEGDVWLRGATISVLRGSPGQPGEQAMFLQGARIDGFLEMDGGWDYSNCAGLYRRFRCNGEINLVSAVIGRSLTLGDAVVEGDIKARELTVDDDMWLSGSVCGDIDLAGCRITGSLEMAGLSMGTSAERFSVKDGNIGRSLRLAPGYVSYRLEKARSYKLRSLPGVELIETLWRHEEDPQPRAADLVPEEYRLVQAGFLRLGRRLWPLDGRASIFDRVVRAVGHKVDNTTVEEFLRLYCAWCYQEHGLFRIVSLQPPRLGEDATEPSWLFDVRGVDGDVRRNGSFKVIAHKNRIEVVREDRTEAGPPEEVVADAPRFVGGLLLLPPLPKAVQLAHLAAPDWLAGPTLGDMIDVPAGHSLDRLHHQLHGHVQHRTLLRGVVDLENSSCDMLDDHAGRAWGGDVQQIRMNHFVYRRATWATERALRKPTHRRFFSWVGRAIVEGLWPAWIPLPQRWRKRPLHWEPWQSRRNWIYHQYPGAFGQPYVFRHKIGHESEYYPQPFEQAIRVARAEGRENIAINFEMLKSRIEWRMFNLRSRWWLGFVGFVAAYIWGLRHGGDPLLIAIALLATMATMLWASFFHGILSNAFPRQWVHHPLMEVLFAVPAIALYFADDWGSRPLHFAIAVLIFIVIRSASWLADLVLRVCFGYLRRPLRAIVTLMIAFLIGWWGVHRANQTGESMFVVDAEPVAGVTLTHAVGELMGSEHNPGAHRDIPCRPTLIEPLYALDVLIPLIDLREESRCEVRRLPQDGWPEPPHADEITSPLELVDALPELTRRNHHFWAVLKVLYAIAGWFIVSLALLTFMQVNRVHAEPPTEHK